MRLSVHLLVSVLQNFLTIEPLCQADAPGESSPGGEEAVVASIRSAMKELQESVEDLCRSHLTKIATTCQCFSSLYSL